MRGFQMNEFDVAFPAMQIWAIYSTLLLPEIVGNIPNFFRDLQITGDGSVGTLFDIYTLPGAPFPRFREEIVTLDQKRMIKEVQLIEGGLLTMGYTSSMSRFEIIKKGANVTTVRSSFTYEIRDQNYTNEASTSVRNLATILNAVVQYLNRNSTASPSANNSGSQP